MNAIKQIIGMFCLIVLLSGMPLMLYTEKDEVRFEPGNIVSHAVFLVEQIGEGTLGTYWIGSTERDIAKDIIPYTENTFKLLFSSVLVSVLISVAFGLFLQRFRIVRLLQRILDVLSTIPDFILILFLILIAISFYKLTGMRIITLSPVSDAQNDWFPITVLSLGPTIFLLRVVSTKYVQISGEDYIGTALAKGMSRWHIQLHHVYKNIKPFLFSDLKKAIAITVANLFIVEYTLNVVGLTRFIFSRESSYQFTTAVMGLMGIIFLSILVYMLIRLILYVFERTLIYR